MVSAESAAALPAIRAGIVAGLFTCLAYPLLVFAPLPRTITVTLAACIGPALAVASFGLAEFLGPARIAAKLGVLLNALAGALFTAMLLVQLAVGYAAGKAAIPAELRAVWLGLDVAWDAYIGLGTICFALAMFRHPRYGALFAIAGLAIGGALLALNFYSFPAPPANAGLVDVGPAVGLWYLAVTVQMWRSLGARYRA